MDSEKKNDEILDGTPRDRHKTIVKRIGVSATDLAGNHERRI